MRRSRFTDEQIIGVLREADAGVPTPRYAADMVFHRGPSTTGRRGSAGWA